VAATLPLLGGTSGGAQPYGYMDPAKWKTFTGWMRDNGLIDSLPAPASVLSDDYLPGEIPAE
jgi:hypothetical protein